MSDKENKSCGWQGFGFGAHYEDAICCEGEVWDLDSCDEPGGPLSNTHGETCPQCNGTGKPVDGERGPMALERLRARNEIQELLDECPDDLRSLLEPHIDGLFRLVRKLEEPQQIDAFNVARGEQRA